MSPRWVAAILSLCLAAIGGGAATAQEPAGQPAAEVDTQRFLMEGRMMSADEVRRIETELEEQPDNMIARVQLLGFYAKGNLSVQAQAARRRHIFWVIENHPDAEVCDTPACVLNSRTEVQAFQHAWELWQAAIEKEERNTKILANAARLMLRNDPSQAQTLLGKAAQVEPDNPEWPRRLAALYGLLSRYGPRDRSESSLGLALENWQRAYELTEDETRKMRMLSSVARAAFDAGEHEVASRYANQALLAVDRLSETNSHGKAIYYANVVLGRVALAGEEPEKAKGYLLAAGRTPGSAALNTYGPSMSLAAELLASGESEVVLEFIELCRGFWSSGTEKLDLWSQEIRDGSTPKFGRHLQF